jgi:hypothetical protein
MGGVVAAVTITGWNAALPGTNTNNPEHTTRQELQQDSGEQRVNQPEANGALGDGVDMEVAERTQVPRTV